MVQLCRNRPEGFGPHSSLHPNIPTTCFLDVIVEPLATWLFLVVLAVLLPLRYRSHLRKHTRSSHPALSSTKPVDEGSHRSSGQTGSHDHDRSPSRFSDPDSDAGTRRARPGIASRILSTLYYVLVVCIVAMVSLEIARLVAADLGIGLLPFVYVGVLAALANRLTWRCRVARLANAAFWVMLAVAMALKTAAEAKEEGGPAERVKGVGKAGLYPSSDEVIDNAVMVGVEAALVGLEFAAWTRLAWL